MWRTILAFSISALITNVSSAIADTHYVSKSGANTPPYTSWETAADSLKPAIEAAEDWDTVRVGPGQYIEDSVQLKTGMTLLGAGIDSTTLEIAVYDGIFTQFILMGDSSRLEGFFLRGKSSADDRAVSFRFGDGGVVRNVRIRNFNKGLHASLISFNNPLNVVEFSNNSVELATVPIHVSDGIAIVRANRIYPPYADPAIYCGGASVVVEGNIIGGLPPEMTRAERLIFYGTEQELIVHNSIYLDFCPNFLVRNNSIWGGAAGIVANNDNEPEPSLSWGTIQNNTCFGLRDEGIRCTRNNVLVSNNIIASAGRLGPAISAWLDSVRFEYNLIWDYDISPNWDTSLAHDNLFLDPMFVDTAEFKLQMFSPAIDAGDPSILDAEGSRSDIGYSGGPGGFSYEYLDLPPAIPRSFAGTPSAIKIDLICRRNSEADFDHYELYRETFAILDPVPELLLMSLSSDTVFADSMIPQAGLTTIVSALWMLRPTPAI